MKKDSHIHWYPGHIAKAERQLKEKLNLCDVVIEVLDARIPESSRNPEIASLVGRKPLISVLSKASLADPNVTARWKIYFEEKLGTPFYFDENIKFCPFCAGKVIRYGKPRYKELPNWDWLEEFRKIIDKTYRYLEYKIHCEIDDEQRKELIKKAEFGEEYFGKDEDE